MKIILILFYCSITTFNLLSQVKLTVEGTGINNMEPEEWLGYNVPRNEPTTFTFRNNFITSVNASGYMLQAGDEGIIVFNSNLDGENITGNKFIWNGTDMTSITHAIFTGFNLNAIIKYNYLYRTPMGILRKSNGMTNTSGGIAYNIINKTSATAVVAKGINGVNIYNNTFYSDEVMYDRPGIGTWRGLIQIYANDSFTPKIPSQGTKVKNNIFYTVNQIYNISISETEDLPGFESDYNLFFCASGTPVFNYLGNLKTFAEWQALGYDKHSIVVNPNFINFIDFVPRSRLDYGTDLGIDWQVGLSTIATWTVGYSPSTTKQNGNWQVGARIFDTKDK